MRPAKWILVDWIGTTTNIRTTVIPELERFGKRCRINADWDYVMDAWGVAQRVFLDQIVAGQAPWRPQAVILIDAFRATLTQVGVNFDEIPKLALEDLGRFSANMKPWSDAQDGIAMLRQIRPVALYSLSPLDSLQMQTREADLDFDRLISAEPYQSYPPSPDGFIGAATELQVSPEQIVFFSVHPPMLRGAENAGMQVIQIDRPMRETRLTLFEPTADLHIQARPRDLQKAAEWLTTHLPTERYSPKG